MASVGVLSSLGPVLRELREERGILLVEVAARLRRSESGLSKFERGDVVPRNLDQVIAGYAAELGVSFSEPWRLAAERANGEELLPLEGDNPTPPTGPGASEGSEPGKRNGRAKAAGSD